MPFVSNTLTPDFFVLSPFPSLKAANDSLVWSSTPIICVVSYLDP